MGSAKFMYIQLHFILRWTQEDRRSNCIELHKVMLDGFTAFNLILILQEDRLIQERRGAQSQYLLVD